MGSMGNKIVGINEVKENKGNNIWRAALAEFVGNVILNLFACATVVVSFHRVDTAMEVVFLIYILVYTLGHVSGGHFNPAVSVAMCITCNIGIIKMFIYIVCQCAGACAGSAILKLISPKDYKGNYGATLVNDAMIDVWQAIVIEFLLGFILLIVVFAFCDPDRTEQKFTGPLAVGCAIGAGHLAFIDLTGSSMNPARSLGSALVANDWENHWVYWVGPISGGVVAALLYRWIFAKTHLGGEIVPQD